jgi:hypothetical protein
VSLADDRSAELDELLDAAWQKHRYGKKYSPAYEVARRIKTIRAMLNCGKENTPQSELAKLWEKIDAQWSNRETDLDPDFMFGEFSLFTAWVLLNAAVSTSKKLREVANALDAETAEDPRQANILKAYTDCVEGRYPPTIAEVGKSYVKCYVPNLLQLRGAFVKRFGQECWPNDYSVRKTLNVLGLPLSKAKRGRPSGSRSQIGNPKRLSR